MAMSVSHISISPTFKINEMISALRANRLQRSITPRTNHNHKICTSTLGEFPTDGANRGGRKVDQIIMTLF